LGLKEIPANGQAWHSLLQAGLPFRSLGTLSKTLHLKESALAELLSLNSRALGARKKAKRFQAQESDLMYALARAYVRLAGFKGTEAAIAWLMGPSELLKGLRPVEFIRSRLGTEYVMTAIERERPQPRFSESKLVLDDVKDEDDDEERAPPF
jgi:putative toxin-antitoxin system antitoxin component (TIGR02293 family)